MLEMIFTNRVTDDNLNDYFVSYSLIGITWGEAAANFKFDDGMRKKRPMLEMIFTNRVSDDELNDFVSYRYSTSTSLGITF